MTEGLRPEVAIFLEGVAGPSALLRDVAGPFCDGNIYKYQLATQGFTVSWFLLEQLPDILPELESMKLLLFPSSTTMSDEVLRAIGTLKSNGRTLAWTGAPAALAAPNASNFSLERTVDTVGIRGLHSHADPASLTTRLVQSNVTGVPHWPQDWVGGLVHFSGSTLAAPWFHFDRNGSGPPESGVCANGTNGTSGGAYRECDFTVTIGAHDSIGHVWPKLEQVVRGQFDECFRMQGCGCSTHDCCGAPGKQEQLLVTRNGTPVGGGHCCVPEVKDFVIGWHRGHCSGPPAPPPSIANNTDVVVLGTFADSGLPSIVWQKEKTHQTFYSSNPDLAGALWRGVAVAAGVHVYQPTSQQDAIEVRGRLLMIHAGPSDADPEGPAVRRTCLLPALARVTDEAGSVVCANCKEFETAPMQPGDTSLYTVELLL